MHITKEKINAINELFFKKFYGLDKDTLMKLADFCKPCSVQWFHLFYEPEYNQRVKLQDIAVTRGLSETDLWEYKLLWSPSCDKQKTVTSIQKVSGDAAIMNILKQSPLFKTY